MIGTLQLRALAHAGWETTRGYWRINPRDPMNTDFVLECKTGKSTMRVVGSDLPDCVGYIVNRALRPINDLTVRIFYTESV